MIRILVADDHTIVRRGLRQIVADESDMEVVGEAQTARKSSISPGKRNGT